ncbi:hypothetical protein CROQUDRAFT_96486 [Cronartium quercuum f. sp. fusiforme G11]|uniref:Uncharacterized protein n=1 Tax=Cronartium quercuum f. sp. fusiforme G11 TaxID=708437 RepID=A0A9P6NGM3_9BASI|nr:hypothetical protein CROQUDRAFT_96486 [Cronartium quercuum f. sp. fusiforme G11]
MQFSSAFFVAALAGTAMALPMVTDRTVPAGKSLERRIEIDPTVINSNKQVGNLVGISDLLSHNNLLNGLDVTALNFGSPVDGSKAVSGSILRRQSTIIDPTEINAIVQKDNLLSLADVASHNEILNGAAVTLLNFDSPVDNSKASLGTH